MLTFNLNKETGILEVVEHRMTWHKTTHYYWYYDTIKWLKSSHGRQGDVPNRIMAAEDIKWVKDYYLPKVTERKAA